jgi:glycoside/pentoside/hexuronide:cation symporter, GPH family
VNRGALALRTKLLYASDSFGGEALTESRGLWLLYYYAPPAHGKTSPLLALGVAGAVLTAVPLVCSLADPLVGWWSDRTSTRLGRRLPFIVTATPFWVLFAVLLFTPPRGASETAIAVYLAVIVACYSVASIASGGPYESLLPELATTSNERMSVNGYKVYFGAAGGGIGLVASGVIVDRYGFLAMALAIASLALIFRAIGTAGVWRHVDRTQRPARVPFRSALRTTLENRYFLLYLPAFVLFQVGLGMTRAALPYYVKAVLGVSKTGTWVAILTTVLIVSFVASVPAQSRTARRSSKRRAFRRAMVGAAIAFSLLSLVGVLPGLPASAQLVAVMAIAGFPVAGVYLFPATLTADIIDYDSLRTGLRREATYYQLHSFVEQAATSLAPGLLALLLLLGDTSGNELGIRLVGPVAALLVLVGWAVFRRYDLPDDVLGQVEPVTGR